MVPAGLRALLSGIIDYAGMFPPAKLPLEEAIRNHARYLTEPEGWMLRWFICPAARLAELGPFLSELVPTTQFLRISVVGRGGQAPDEFLQNLRLDWQDILSFSDRYWAPDPPLALVQAFETRPPTHPDSWTVLCQEAAEYMRLGKGLARYFEIAFPSDWRSAFPLLLRDLAKHHLGCKIRCGGSEPGAIPTAEQVAFAIASCRDAGVYLKATAGLHHPIRRFDDALQTFMHGFVNVFGAAVLAHARNLHEDQVRQIIEDREPANFRFDQEGLRWKELLATVEEIKAARKWVHSFGSCSFDEPLADLKELGWLPQEEAGP